MPRGFRLDAATDSDLVVLRSRKQPGGPTGDIRYRSDAVPHPCRSTSASRRLGRSGDGAGRRGIRGPRTPLISPCPRCLRRRDLLPCPGTRPLVDRDFQRRALHFRE